MLFNFRIFLVHNKLTIERITWLSLLIRIFTFGRYNHIAVEVEIHGQMYVIESIGKGVCFRSYEKWAGGSNRIVLPMLPMAPMPLETFHKLLSAMGEPYGFGDLLRIAWYFINVRWFGREVKVKNGKGWLCNEIGCLLMGYDWLIVPNEFQYAPGLVRGEEFTTTKTN